MNANTKLFPLLFSLLIFPSLVSGQEVKYSIIADSFAPLAGNSSSQNYAQFSATEPLAGLSVKNLPDFKNFQGLIGQLPPLDQDGDGISDVNEMALGTDKTKADTDGDGLTDGEEKSIGTNPMLADTDGDGYTDYDEVNAETNATNFSSNPNQPPYDLVLSHSTIPENQPISSLVGNFSASDPDVDQVLTFSLLSMAGDSNNSYFDLETNGTLKTNFIFDYENSENQFSILVQVTDEFNSSISKKFTISITDLNDTEISHPIVDNPQTEEIDENQSASPSSQKYFVITGSPSIENSSVTLAGQISGNYTSVIETGFLISNDILFKEYDKLIFSSQLSHDGNYSIHTDNFTLNKTYYVRAFANEGNFSSVGKIERVFIDGHYDVPFNANIIESSWYKSDWFGIFKRANENWVFHTDLNWLYVESSSASGTWFWCEKIGWGWTRNDLWPYIWTNAPQGWVYFFGNQDGTLTFWDYTNSEYLKL